MRIYYVDKLMTGVLSVGNRILYLYKKENVCYREKRKGTLFWEEKNPGGEEDSFLKIFYCGIPEYYGIRTVWRKRRHVPWNSGQLLGLMQNCCEYVSADACYLEENFERALAAWDAGFMPGRQRMCGGLIRKLSGQFREIDSILYLGEEFEGRGEELPLSGELLRRLRYFFYMGEKGERYGALEENLWKEYGMPVLAVRSTKELAACPIKRLLVLDDRLEGGADWAMLPRGCVYLDLWSDAGRRDEILRRRVDIKYMSEYLYLCQNR